MGGEPHWGLRPAVDTPCKNMFDAELQEVEKKFQIHTWPSGLSGIFVQAGGQTMFCMTVS